MLIYNGEQSQLGQTAGNLASLSATMRGREKSLFANSRQSGSAERNSSRDLFSCARSDPDGRETDPKPREEGGEAGFQGEGWRLSALDLPQWTSPDVKGPLVLLILHSNPDYWSDVEEGFGTLEELTRADDVPGCLMILPLFVEFEDYPYVEQHQQILSAAGKRGFATFDLFDSMQDYDEYDLRLERADVVHPGVKGHQEIALTIREKLRSLGYIK